MNCPFCEKKNSRVTDSRLIKKGKSVRRRRECTDCKSRFTTYESIEIQLPKIHKKDGRREEFRREKLQKGLDIACQKLSISPETIKSIIEKIENELVQLNKSEIRSRFIGNLVMRELSLLNPVAYVRFASVYKSFENIEDFFHNLKSDSYSHREAH